MKRIRSYFGFTASYLTKKTYCKRSLRLVKAMTVYLLNFGYSTINTGQERKYFDSGDYALTKAGKASESGITSISSQHPLPENIPHLSSPGPNGSLNGNGSGNVSQLLGGQSASPVKESSFLYRQTSIDGAEGTPGKGCEEGSISPPQKEAVPIRWQQ